MRASHWQSKHGQLKSLPQAPLWILRFPAKPKEALSLCKSTQGDHRLCLQSLREDKMFCGKADADITEETYRRLAALQIISSTPEDRILYSKGKGAAIWRMEGNKKARQKKTYYWSWPPSLK